MKKRFLLLVVTFGLAVTAMSFGTANALTNTQIIGTHNSRGGISTSNNGRYITYLALGDGTSGTHTNLVYAYLYDTQTSTTSLVSQTSTGVAMSGVNYVVLSKNGRYALFTGSNWTYLRDTKLGATTSIASGLVRGEAVSEDGRFVYYVDTSELYVRDMLLSTTTRVDVNSSGSGSAGTDNAQVGTTCDGRFIVFASSASDLVTGDTNGYSDIFLVDTMNGHTIRDITLGANGLSLLPSITCDGNFVLFVSNASNLVTNDTNSATDLFEYDVQNDTTTLISVDPSGNQYGDLQSPSGGLNYAAGGELSSLDGRYVVFTITKYNSSSTPISGQVFLRDTLAGTTTALSPIGSNTFASWPTITYDGRTVYYGYSNFSGGLNNNIYSATDYL